jgi:hypothetical protein
MMSDTLQFVVLVRCRRVQSQLSVPEHDDKLKRIEHRMSDTLQFVDVVRDTRVITQLDRCACRRQTKVCRTLCCC